MDGRRPLALASLSEVMPEVDRLLRGHRVVGRWSLAQACNHLTAATIGAIEGSALGPPWIIRKTLGPLIFRGILRTGRFPSGVKIPEGMGPAPGLDARAEAEALRAAIQVFGRHPGPFADHPLAGPIDRAAWDRFLAIHAAHHLSFVVPEPMPSPAGDVARGPS